MTSVNLEALSLAIKGPGSQAPGRHGGVRGGRAGSRARTRRRIRAASSAPNAPRSHTTPRSANCARSCLLSMPSPSAGGTGPRNGFSLAVRRTRAAQ